MTDFITDTTSLFLFTLGAVYLFVGRQPFTSLYAAFRRFANEPRYLRALRFLTVMSGREVKKRFRLKHTYARPWDIATRSRPSLSLKLAALYTILIPAIFGAIHFSEVGLQEMTVYDWMPRLYPRVTSHPLPELFSFLRAYSWLLIGVGGVFLFAGVNRSSISKKKAAWLFGFLYLFFFVIVPEIFGAIEYSLPRDSVIKQGVKTLIPSNCTPFSLFPMILDGGTSCWLSLFSMADYSYAKMYYSIILIILTVSFAIRVGPVRLVILVTILQVFFFWKFPISILFGVDFWNNAPGNSIIGNADELSSHLFVNAVVGVSFVVNGLSDHISVSISYWLLRRTRNADTIGKLFTLLLTDSLVAIILVIINCVLFVAGTYFVGSIVGDTEIAVKAIDYLTFGAGFTIKSLCIWALVATPVWPTFALALVIGVVTIFRLIAPLVGGLARRLKQEDKVSVFGVELEGIDIFIAQVCFVVSALVALGT